MSGFMGYTNGSYLYQGHYSTLVKAKQLVFIYRHPPYLHFFGKGELTL